MSTDGAKALVAKVLSDQELAKELDGVKNEDDFQLIVGKLGYNVTPEEFKTAFDAAKKDLLQKGELLDTQMDQVAGGMGFDGSPYRR